MPRKPKETVKPHIEPLDAKKRLFDVARALFAEKGFKATTVRDISKVAGLNISLVSYYFKSKEGLYGEILCDLAARHRSLKEQAAPTAKTLADYRAQLERLVEVTFSEYGLDRDGLSILSREIDNLSPVFLALMPQVFQNVVSDLSGFFQYGHDHGFIRPSLSPALLTHMLVSHVIYFGRTEKIRQRGGQPELNHSGLYRDIAQHMAAMIVEA